MIKKMLIVFTVLAVLVAFSLPCFAETVKGKVTAYDKDAKKIQIDDKEYTLSDEALTAEVAEGDEVEAEVDGGTVNQITKQ
jgi:hypothetical protein